MNNHKIAVIGGTGKSGKYLVNELLRQGYNIKLLSRNPEKTIINHPNVEVVIGNATDSQSIHSLLNGTGAVISTLGLGVPASEPNIFSKATQNIINSMILYQIRRYIVTTGLNVNTEFDRKNTNTILATQWMYQNFPISTNDKQLEYEALLASNIDWTLVRLPMIEMTDTNDPISTSLEDCLGQKIGATSLANFLVNQLNDTTFISKSPFVFNL